MNYAVGTTPTAVVMADFDGNGNLDVAVANGGSNNVSVLMGNGDGTLGTATSYSVGSNPVALAVEYSGSELVVGDHGSSDFTVLANTGNGFFVSSQTIPLGESPDAVATASFSGNGVLDYVTDEKLLKGVVPFSSYAATIATRKDLFAYLHAITLL